MRDIVKRFGGVPVIRHAQFSLLPGEIHALTGENGAGKSALMKILAGIIRKDAGSVLVNGREVRFHSPTQAERAGIGFVHQEPTGLPELSVEANLFLGREIRSRFGILRKRQMRNRVRILLESLELKLRPEQLLRDLSAGQRRAVEIARAFLVNAEAVILDEPTSALTERERRKFFELLRFLKKNGASFVLISHRIDEIFALCDRVTVMRNGECVGTRLVRDMTKGGLVQMMLGRNLSRLVPGKTGGAGGVLLRAVSLGKRGAFSDVSLEARAGEILGLAGLSESGGTEIARALFGASPADSGSLYVRGKEIPLRAYSPRTAKSLGIAFVTGCREEESLMAEEPVSKNIALANFPRVTRLRFILNPAAERKLARKACEALRIRRAVGDPVCGDLNCGDRQKVALAKWLYTKPDIVILDEPTRGLDIGAGREIDIAMIKMAERGVAVILVSSDLPEILGVCDRIAVVRDGRIRGVLNRKSASRAAVTAPAAGGRSR